MNDPAETKSALNSARIGIVGLESHGAYLALLLAQCGVGTLILSDPYLYRPEHVSMTPLFNSSMVSQPRHTAMSFIINKKVTSTKIETVGDGCLKETDLKMLANKSDIVVNCLDHKFLPAHYWLNRASLSRGIPALYSELQGGRALLGPLVLPDRTACYTCYRLRRIACAGEYSKALQNEKQLCQQNEPQLYKRSVLPELSIYAANILCIETLKHSLLMGTSRLTAKVIEFEVLSSVSKTHSVLKVSNCPECKSGLSEPPMPELQQLMISRSLLKGTNRSTADLISPRTGIIRQCCLIPNDDPELETPFFYRAELANHWHDQQPPVELMCGFGKGMNHEQALESAIGEALELYSGTLPAHRNVIHKKRQDLERTTLDPRDLVLYRHEQYQNIPFYPYSDETVFGWVKARSLKSGSLVYVPALAVYLDYELRSAEELLFPILSNGLATGSTLVQAILFALYEVLERDAFIITWLNKLPCFAIDPHYHPDPKIREFSHHMKNRGYDFRLYALPTDHCCRVIMAVCHQLSGRIPAIMVGMGADLNAENAARKAVLELAQAHAGIIHDLRQKSNLVRMQLLSTNPHHVSSMDDHALLYASPDMSPAFDFLFDQDLQAFDWGENGQQSPAAALHRILYNLFKSGNDVLYVNLTPNEISQLGFYTVRVIVPHFQPIHFGYSQRRLGGSRLFELPVQLGFIDFPKAVHELNENPHPLG